MEADGPQHRAVGGALDAVGGHAAAAFAFGIHASLLGRVFRGAAGTVRRRWRPRQLIEDSIAYPGVPALKRRSERRNPPARVAGSPRRGLGISERRFNAGEAYGAGGRAWIGP